MLQKVADETGAIPIAADATSADDIKRLIQTTLEKFGKINGLVLNAGIIQSGSVTELADEDWDKMINVNLSASFRLLKEAIPHLIATRGAVVGVGSAAALRVSNSTSGYNASKAGMVMLIQSVAVDYGRQGVRANAVCPGWVRTEMADMEMKEFGESLGIDAEEAYKLATSFVPCKRPGESKEVGRVIAWLLSEEASYVNAAVLPVDGGMIAGDPGALAINQSLSA